MHRPWGNYQSLDNGDRYQVKRIVVKPGGRLSLQISQPPRRALGGGARHRAGDHRRRGQDRCTRTSRSIFRIGTPHRLENPGKIDLELIEVQTGSYLGEDDIVRIEDDYHALLS